jgi:predicted SAM-dependent methyltransferase
MKGLNIGCGPVILQTDHIEWENSDFADTESSQSWKIDKKRDFTQPMTDIEDNSIDFIIAWHIIEHVGLHENANLVTEWFRVLKPGGKLFIACPNIKAIAQNIVAGTPPWNDPYIMMVNLFGPYNGYVGDYHKWGYTPESLSELLTRCGFSQVNPNFTIGNLASNIGGNNANKVGFADYNLQMEAIK